jgi:gas vesicle protein
VKYNEIVASNKLLRDDVDVIRRERVTLRDVRTQLGDQLHKISSKAEEMHKKYRLRSEVVGEMKEKLLQLKDKNTDQQKIYIQEFDHLQVHARAIT